MAGRVTKHKKVDCLPGDLDFMADENTVLIERTLRSGQSVHYRGHVVILGDVNPGAIVAASGNVVVVGALRGMVHAGMEGDTSAFVMALLLQPTQLRVADHITRPPDGEPVQAECPEIARIRDGVVTIEAYWPGGK